MPNFTASNSAFENIRAPRGTQLNCKGWKQEAALRMLMNSCDERVRAQAQFSLHSQHKRALPEWDWRNYDKIADLLRKLDGNETLLLAPDRAASVLKTREASPRVLILNPGEPEGTVPLPPAKLALRLMEGALPGSSWMNDTFQESLHFTFQTLSAVAEKYFAGDFSGKFVVNCGMEAVGSLISVAATMNGAAFLGIDADPEEIKRQLKAGRCDFMVNSLDEALRILKNAVRKKENVSVGLVADCGETIQKFSERGVLPDILNMVLGPAPENAAVVQHAEGFPDFAAEYILPVFAAGRRPFCWLALSGESADIFTGENTLLELFPENGALRRWIEAARRRVKVQGLPSRICWLNPGEQKQFILAIHQLIKGGKIKAPIVARIDHLEPQSNFGLAEKSSSDQSPAMSEYVVQKLLTETEGSAWISAQNVGGIKEACAGNENFMRISRAILIDGEDATIAAIKTAVS